MRARASAPVFPATKNSFLSRINGIVCLASSRRSYRSGRPFFFLLEIPRGARAQLAILNFHGVATAIVRSRPGGSREPLKYKRKGDENARRGP